MVIASVGFASVEIASVGIANSESLIVRGAVEIVTAIPPFPLPTKNRKMR